MKANIKKYKNSIFTFLIILLFSYSGCSENPIEKAKEMIKNDNIIIAIELLNEEIADNPANIDIVVELCFSEGINLLEKDKNNSADSLGKYAIKIIKAHKTPIPESFFNYLSSMNNKEAIINFSIEVIKENPTYYNRITQIINQLNFITNIKQDSYHGQLNEYDHRGWLMPSDSGTKIFGEKLGMSSFRPDVSYYLLGLSLDEVMSLSTEAIYNSITTDQFHYNQYSLSGLYLSLIPEITTFIADLRGKDKYHIAIKKEEYIQKILESRERYLIPNLKYIFSQFEVQGYCILYEKEYNFDSQEALIHMFLSTHNYTYRYEPIRKMSYYVATAKVPLSVDKAEKLFNSKTSNEKYVDGKVFFILSPGIGRRTLYFGSYGRSAVPNLLSLQEPEIVINNFQFTVEGLIGELFPFDRNDIFSLPKPVNYRIVNVKY